jgi:hypothetical protein
MYDSCKDCFNSGISFEGQYIRELLSSLVRGELSHKLPEPVPWQNVDKLAQTQAIVAICRRLIPSDIIPDEIRLNWDHICAENFLNTSMALNGVRRILSVLEEGGVPAAVLRGIRLAYEIYPDPVMRPMRDVDILIPPDSHVTVRTLLAQAGMEPQKFLRSQLVYRIHGKDYEIHWSYVTPRRYRGVASYHQWLNDTRAVATPQGDVRSLSLENELLGLIIHAFLHHDLNRISQLVDIALVMKRDGLDWDYIKRWAADARLSKMLAFVLAYVEWLFTMPPGHWTVWSRGILRYGHEAVFASYAALSLGQDARQHYLTRKMHLLEVAETFPRKAKQLMRFLNLKELMSFVTTTFLGSKGNQKKGKS